MGPPRSVADEFRIPNSALNRGLTFVELLLAVAVFAILMTGLSSHLRGSVVVWRRVTSTAEHLQRIRVTFDRLRNDLAQAFLFAPTATTTPPGPSWTPEPKLEETQLKCYTIQAPQKTDEPHEVVVVTYRLDGNTLIRQVQTAQEAHAASTNPTRDNQGKEEQLLKDVAQVKFEYGSWSTPAGNKIDWLDPWDFSQHGLPQLVKVTVTFPQKKDAPEPRTVQETFVIPVGTPMI